MDGLQSTPTESPYHTGSLPQSYQKPHDSSHAYSEAYTSPRTYESYPEPVSDRQYVSQLEPVYNPDRDPLKRENEPPVVPVKENSRICGLRKRVFFTVLTVLIVLVAAIVGGVTGGVLGTRHKSSSQTDQNTSSQSALSTAPSTASASSTAPSTTSNVSGTLGTPTPVAAPSPMRSIVATQAEVTIFHVWQKSDGDLYMHGYYNVPSTWAAPSKLNLTYPAIDNTPMAVLAWEYNDYFEIRLQYAAQGQSSLGSLEFRCYQNGSLCTEPSNTMNTAIPAPPAGTGSALVTPELNMLRTYYIGSDGSVLQAGYTPQNDWTAPVAISNGAKAHLASPIGVTMVKDDIWLFWFSDQKQLQYTTSTYTESTWSAVQNISATIPKELPRSIGVARSDTPDVTQIFYLDGIEMQQAQYSNNGWSNSNLGSSTPNSSISNGPMAAVGWNDTAVRLYYVDDNAIVEVASESTYGTWELGTMDPDDYD